MMTRMMTAGALDPPRQRYFVPLADRATGTLILLKETSQRFLRNTNRSGAEATRFSPTFYYHLKTNPSSPLRSVCTEESESIVIDHCGFQPPRSTTYDFSDHYQNEIDTIFICPIEYFSIKAHCLQFYIVHFILRSAGYPRITRYITQGDLPHLVWILHIHKFLFIFQTQNIFSLSHS